MPNNHPENLDKQITITCVVNAPVESVFRAWVEPEQLVKWYNAGEGWTTPYAETDPQAGGKFKIGFQSPDSKGNFDFQGTYDEVIPNEKIAFTIMGDDRRKVIILFEKQDGKTKVDLILTLETEYPEDHQRKGWTAMLENLSKLFT